MVDKISNILFHPKSLIQFSKTHLLKALLYIFLLGFFSSLVSMIDLVKFEGYHRSQQQEIENITGFDFSVAKDLPDCVLANNELSCDNNNQMTNIGTAFGMVNIMIDPNNKYIVSDNDYYLILTKDAFKLRTRFASMAFTYDSLPEEWQSFNFTEIKQSKYPEDALLDWFLGGFNPLVKQYIPYAIVIVFLIGFFTVLFEILFISLMFKLFFRGFGYKYREIFKVAVFAQTFPILLGMIFQLLGVQFGYSTLVTVLGFMYIYQALKPKTIQKNME
jgi:Protein of unknown function (DUF1189)